MVFSGCIRVCHYSWWESIQLCLVVVYECVTTSGGSPYVVFSVCIRVCDYSWEESIQLCLVVVYHCVTTRGGSPYSCV